jgi:hypothetical protein
MRQSVLNHQWSFQCAEKTARIKQARDEASAEVKQYQAQLDAQLQQAVNAVCVVFLLAPACLSTQQKGPAGRCLSICCRCVLLIVCGCKQGMAQSEKSTRLNAETEAQLMDIRRSAEVHRVSSVCL